MEYYKEKDGFKYHYSANINKERLLDLARQLKDHYADYPSEIDDLGSNFNYANYSCPQLNYITTLLLHDDPEGIRRLIKINLKYLNPLTELVNKQHEIIKQIDDNHRTEFNLNQLKRVKDNIVLLSKSNEDELNYLRGMINAMRTCITLKFVERTDIPRLIYKR
jgi:hypothetical protein